MNNGVLQGIFRVPMLFSVYKNELSYLSNLSNFTLFANDTTAAMRDNNVDNLFFKMKYCTGIIV